MAIQKSPAFQFYAKDFLVGTAAMTLVERGAYVTLLAHEWDAGSVPALAPARARVLGCTPAQERKIWQALAPKFVLQDGAYINVRLEEERRKQAEYRRRQSDNGKASAQARKGNQPTNQRPNQKATTVQPPLQPDGQPNGNSSVFSLQSSKDKEQKDSPSASGTNELLAYFDQVFAHRNNGEKPADPTVADRAAAKRLCKTHGIDKAKLIVRQAFLSRDRFISEAGKSMAFIASNNVQNRLIAELAAARKPEEQAKPASLRVIDEMEAKRHAG